MRFNYAPRCLPPLYILIIIVLIFSAFNLHAGEGKEFLRVAAFNIPGVIEEDGSGKYNKFIQKISALTDIEFEISILPIARARAAYAEGGYDCLLPLDPEFEGRFLNHIRFTPFDLAKLYAFTNKGSRPITTIRGLKGLRVAGQIGTPYPHALNKIIGKNKVEQLKSLVIMLDLDRIDAFVAYTPDITEFFKHEGIIPLSYEPRKPLSIYKDSLTCRPTKRNYEIFGEINFAIEHILESLF